MDLKTPLIRTYYPSIPTRINMGTNFNPIEIEKDDITTEDGNINIENAIEKINNYTREVLIDQILTLPLPSKDATSYNSTLMRKDLEHLNRKLSAVRKTITAWDTYKITEVVTEKNLLAGKIQGLPLNSSLVVNTSEPVYLNGKTYQLGDIVFKDINGNLHQIKSSPSGFFYPSKIGRTINEDEEFTNTVQVDYSFFAGSQPTLPTQTIERDPVTQEINALTQPSHIITAAFELQEDNNFYNITGILQSPPSSDASKEINILTDKEEKNLVLPKVFAYLYEEDTKIALEEIYIDNLVEIVTETNETTDETTGETINKITGKITISNPTTLTIKYIMR